MWKTEQDQLMYIKLKSMKVNDPVHEKQSWIQKLGTWWDKITETRFFWATFDDHILKQIF